MNKLTFSIARSAIFIMAGVALGLSAPAQANIDHNEGENIPDAVTVDEDNNTFIIYPELLAPCDNEDGTTSSAGVAQDACYWDSKGTGRSFITLSR